MKKVEITKGQASEFIRTASDFAEYLKGETDADRKKAFVMVAVEEDEASSKEGYCMITCGGGSNNVEMGLTSLLLHDKRLLKNVIERIMAERLMEIIKD